MLGFVNCVQTDRAEHADASGAGLLLLWLKTITFVYFEPLSQLTLFGEVCGIEQGIKNQAQWMTWVSYTEAGR